MTVTEAIEVLNSMGIESRIQHTYFADEVCVHLNGNNNPAQIFPSESSFLGWFNAVDLQSLQNDGTEYDEEFWEDYLAH